jgi:hypothetical protein
VKSNHLYLVNASTLVTDEEVSKMAHAINVQLRDHADPAWEKQRVITSFHEGKDLVGVQASVPRTAWVMIILDTPDQAGALGWHWQDDKDRVYSEIFAKPCLDAGSAALTGKYAVSSVASHEALETFGDPFCNGWSDTGRGFLVAQELCDPVEADGYLIDGVQVSNFILPEWFDPTVSAGEKFDWQGKLTQPFAMTPGGYWVQMPSGTETQKFNELVSGLKTWGFDVRESGQVVFSPEMPPWVREGKLSHLSRNAYKRALVAS